MNNFYIIEFLLGIIILVTAIYTTYQYAQYRKIKRLYNSKDHRHFYLRSQLQKLYPLIPKSGSKRYSHAQKYINEAGWKISVERLYAIKYISMLLVLVLAVGIRSTNTQMNIENILVDMHYKKVAMDDVAASSKENISMERELFTYFNTDIADDKRFTNQANAPVYQKYIEEKIIAKGWEYEDENPDITAKRLYYKLLAVRTMQNSKIWYSILLLISILAFFAPELIASLKIKLIVEKKYWEVINLSTVYSVFGSLPPYSLTNVVDNMVIVADVFKSIIIKLRDGVKDAKVDTVYNNVLEQIDNEELYELIENMQLSNEVGLKESVKNIDEMIENNLENIKVMNIYRRETKNIYSMIPAYIVITIALVYAAYGIVPLANPFNVTGMLNK